MMNSTQRQGGLQRATSLPAPSTRKILAEADIQNRIAAFRQQTAGSFRRSVEVNDLKAKIIDEWVSDTGGSVVPRAAASDFASCPLSAKQKAKVIKFALKCLEPSSSDDEMTRAVKQKAIARKLIEQCLGLKPLTMRVQEQGILELAFGVISEAPFIENSPEYGWLKDAVEHCPNEIARVDRNIKARMKWMAATAMQNLLHAQPHRIAARDTIHAIDAPAFHLDEVEVQRFIGGVHHLIDGQPVEENELDIVWRFAPRLQRHVPRSMLAEFAEFVDVLNLYRKNAGL